MSENSCILVKEIDCDNVVLVEEIKTAVIVTPNPDVVIVACEQGEVWRRVAIPSTSFP